MAALELVPERDAWIVDDAKGDSTVSSISDLKREYVTLSACTSLLQSRGSIGFQTLSLREADVFGYLLDACKLWAANVVSLRRL